MTGRRRKKLLMFMRQGPLRRVLAEVLSLRGYEVSVAEYEVGEPALSGQQAPDLVLCDVSMWTAKGEGNPPSVAGGDRGAGILAFSEVPTAEMARRARDLGAREYLGDPFDLRTLFRAIAAHAGGAPRASGPAPDAMPDAPLPGRKDGRSPGS